MILKKTKGLPSESGACPDGQSRYQIEKVLSISLKLFYKAQSSKKLTDDK